MTNSPEIPGYKIKRELGFGGMSRVYLAVEDKLKRQVALKVLLPSLAEKPRVTKRFVKEARTAAQLQHSNIVSIYAVGKNKDCYFIAMEYMKESLKDRLKKNNTIKPEEALRIVKEIAAALSYAHQKGFIHRDIKPDNIMFREDGAVVLVDFGIVKALKSDTKLTKTGMSVGTPKYMSPEQIKAGKIDGRADIYSLGIVLHEILVGKAPYDADDVITLAMKHTEDPVPKLPARFKNIQPLLEKMLAKTPRQRVKTAEGLIRLVNALEYELKTKKGTITTPVPQNKGNKFKNFLWYLVALLVIISLGYGSCYFLEKSQQNKPNTQPKTYSKPITE